MNYINKGQYPESGIEVLAWVDGKRNAGFSNNHAVVAFYEHGKWQRYDGHEIDGQVVAWENIESPFNGVGELVENNKKFTAIYTENWFNGSHMYSLTQMRRIEQFDGETVEEMLHRENLIDSVQYLFHGHPPLQGE